ncbi:hypothetical protein BaRGS_00025456, partial [Batillaria attramentaria]
STKRCSGKILSLYLSALFPPVFTTPFFQSEHLGFISNYRHLTPSPDPKENDAADFSSHVYHLLPPNK